MSRGAVATVDRAALRHNLARVRDLAPRARIAGAIKANGYGHGGVAVARTLAGAGCDAFAVACLSEAIALREAGISQPVLLLQGPLAPDEWTTVAALDLQAVVHTLEQLEWLKSAPHAAFEIWIKIDSGMHRLGFRPTQLAAVRERLSGLPHVRVAGWMTHLACADDVTSDATPSQLHCFQQAVENFPGARSIANSAAVVAWPDCHVDWVRPGIMLYGASPMLDRSAAELNLRPVMTLTGQLIAIRHVEAGEAIGYGATWRAPERMPVGVVSIGYGDGYPRHAPSGTPLCVNGQRTGLVGRVSMDMIAVDLRPVGRALIGDPVELWGSRIPVDEVAAAAGTIAYELFCSVASRVAFHYIDTAVGERD